jgi:hypothetical protein
MTASSFTSPRSARHSLNGPAQTTPAARIPPRLAGAVQRIPPALMRVHDLALAMVPK